VIPESNNSDWFT